MELALNEEKISLDSLIRFLESQRFFPKREDLEAILRRVDHKGDHSINFEEFCEITSLNEFNLSPEEAELESSRHSPIKEEIQKDLKESHAIHRSNSNQERLDSLEDSIDKMQKSP